MSSTVKAALIAEVGSLLYAAIMIFGLQAMYAYLLEGNVEKAWVVQAWRWWEARAERRWIRTLEVYHRAPGEEPPVIDLQVEGGG